MITLVVAVISFSLGTVVMAAVIALLKSGTRRDLENEIAYLKADIISLKDENENVKEQRDKLIGKVTEAYNAGVKEGRRSLIKETVGSMLEDHEQNSKEKE